MDGRPRPARGPAVPPTSPKGTPRGHGARAKYRGRADGLRPTRPPGNRPLVRLVRFRLVRRRTPMLWACPACPDFGADPLGWLRFRLKVATEVDTVEWWYGENLLFVGALFCTTVVPVLFFAGWRLWAAAGEVLGV